MSTTSIEPTSSQSTSLSAAHPTNGVSSSQATGATAAVPAFPVKTPSLKAKQGKDSDSIELIRPLRPANHPLFLPFHHPPPRRKTNILLHILMHLLLLPRLAVILFFLFLSWSTARFVPSPYSRMMFPYLSRSVLFACGFFSIRITRDSSSKSSQPSHAEEQEQEGEEEEGSYALISNHTSMLDPLVLIYTHCAGFVAKDSIATVPIIGTITKALNSLFVDRLKGQGNFTARLVERQHLLAKRCHPSPYQMNSRLDESGKDNEEGRIVIFPEGTTTNGKYMLKYRSGGFVSKLPVQPILIYYPFETFSPTYETIRWYKFLYYTLIQPINFAEVIVMPVYRPSEEEKEDPKLYAENVRKVMKERLDVEFSEARFEDKLEFHHVVRGDPIPKHLIKKSQAGRGDGIVLENKKEK